MKIEHALIAVSPLGVIRHMVAYDNVPEYEDYFSVSKELQNDPQFNMTELKYGTDYILIPANKSTLEMINDDLETRPEDFTIVTHGEKDE